MDENALHGQCFGVWKEGVKAEMERNGFTPFDVTTIDWVWFREAYYNIGLSPHETVIEEMVAGA